MIYHLDENNSNEGEKYLRKSFEIRQILYGDFPHSKIANSHL